MGGRSDSGNVIGQAPQILESERTDAPPEWVVPIPGRGDITCGALMQMLLDRPGRAPGPTPHVQILVDLARGTQSKSAPSCLDPVLRAVSDSEYCYVKPS